MRIDSNHKLQNVTDISVAEQAGTRAQNSVAKGNLAGDRTELSPEQARVNSLVSRANQLPDVRQDKVNALGLAIQQGRYEVTPEQTAAAMLNEMRTAA